MKKNLLATSFYNRDLERQVEEARVTRIERFSAGTRTDGREIRIIQEIVDSMDSVTLYIESPLGEERIMRYTKSIEDVLKACGLERDSRGIIENNITIRVVYQTKKKIPTAIEI